MVERVQNPNKRQGELTSDDVLLGTGVNIPREPGTKFPNIPFSGAKGISEFVSTGFVASLSGNGSDSLVQPTPSATLIQPGLKINPTSNSPTSSPAYFVTEPPDSPKNPHPTPEHIPTPFNLPQPLPALIIPAPNSLNTNLEPNKPTSPKNLDITLATVFKSLNLKRKSFDDLQEPNSSKILRICSPNPPTLPESNPKPTTRSNRKPSKSPRGLKSAKKGNGTLIDESLHVEGLVEIPIQQSQDSYGVAEPLSSVEPMENVEDILHLNGKGLVAGPKQPHSQC